MDDNSKKNKDQDSPNMTNEERKDYAIIEILMRLSALEKVLVEKDIVKQEELIKYIKSSTDTLLEHMKVSADKAAINVLNNKDSLKN